MAKFQGGERASLRVRHLEKQRQVERQAFEENLKKLSKEAEKGVVPIEKKFLGHVETVEMPTVGLVSLEEFRNTEVLMKQKKEEEKEEEKERKAIARKRKIRIEKAKLSFALEEEEEEEGGGGSGGGADEAKESSKKPKLRDKKEDEDEQKEEEAEVEATH